MTPETMSVLVSAMVVYGVTVPLALQAREAKWCLSRWEYWSCMAVCGVLALGITVLLVLQLRHG